MNIHPRKLEKLKRRMQHVLKQQNIQAYRTVIEQINNEMVINPVDCAAALLFINQPHLFQNPTEKESSVTFIPPFKPPINRNVRYRLDVGSRHQITEEQLVSVLVEESGVDRKRISRVDIRETYTLVDLPDGMPADIFQLLCEATVEGHRLNIKRVKRSRRKTRDFQQSNGNFRE